MIGATLAALWPVCFNDFTTWDDYPNVARNPLLNPFTFQSLQHFWAHPFIHMYIPLTYTVWGALSLVARMDSADSSGVWLSPWIFHIANLCIHVVAALVVYQLLNALTHRPWAALGGALLFALHPLQVEAVAWVTGMRDVLCGALSLIALWQYVLYAKSSDDVASREVSSAGTIHYAAATLALILAMLSKPSAMIVPFAAVLLDHVLLRRPWKRVLRALWPWLLLALVCAIVAKLSQPVPKPADGGRILARPFLAADALTFYLYKLVWPARLAVHYHFSPDAVLAGRWVWFAWVVPATIFVVLWIGRRRWPWLLASAGLMVVAILPVLGLVPFEFEKRSIVADHYLYFAMIGPAMAFSFMLASVRHPKVGAVAATCCLVAWGIRSNLQTAHWRDTVTLFEHELTVNPSSEVAYGSLAERAMMNRQPELAEAFARKSIQYQPVQVEAYVNLASALSVMGRTKEALEVSRIAADKNPNNARAVCSLATLLDEQSQGSPAQLEKAIQLCRRSVELDELWPFSRRKLAGMLLRQGHISSALREAQAAVDLDADDPRNQMALASALDAAGQPQAAIEHLNKALHSDPKFEPAVEMLARLRSLPPDQAH